MSIIDQSNVITYLISCLVNEWQYEECVETSSSIDVMMDQINNTKRFLCVIVKWIYNNYTIDSIEINRVLSSLDSGLPYHPQLGFIGYSELFTHAKLSLHQYKSLIECIIYTSMSYMDRLNLGLWNTGFIRNDQSTECPFTTYTATIVPKYMPFLERYHKTADESLKKYYISRDCKVTCNRPHTDITYLIASDCFMLKMGYIFNLCATMIGSDTFLQYIPSITGIEQQNQHKHKHYTTITFKEIMRLYHDFNPSSS
jgi:hypothetical protein